MADRHDRNPITFRPAKRDEPWLYEYAQLHGMTERSVLGQALAAFRMSKEQEETGWIAAELLELIKLVLAIIDIPSATIAVDSEQLKRARQLDDRLREVMAVFRWCADQEKGSSLKYIIGHLKDQMEKMPPPDYHTDYASYLAEQRGETVEETRAYLNSIKTAAAIRTEIEQ